MTNEEKTERNLEIERLYTEGASIHQIARKYELNRGTIKAILVNRGVTLRERNFVGEDKERMIRMYRSGMPVDDIAAATGWGKITVRGNLIAAGVMRTGSEMMDQQLMDGLRVADVEAYRHSVAIGTRVKIRTYDPYDEKLKVTVIGRIIGLYPHGAQIEIPGKVRPVWMDYMELKKAVI